MDVTGTKERYDFDFEWKEQKWPTADTEISALQSIWTEQYKRIGLELVPTNMPYKMLVVGKAK